MRNLLAFSTAIAVLLSTATPATALAYDTVEVRGTLFICENSCVVSSTSTGRLQVSDSDGGWVAYRTRYAPVPQ